MNRITFRLGIALLTFVVGIATVSLWFVFRRDVEVKKSETSMVKEKEVDKTQPEKTEVYLPKVKAIYISEKPPPHKAVYSSLVIFYENGDFSRIYANLYQVEKQIAAQIPLGYILELGKWNKKDDELAVIVEGRYYSCASLVPPKDIVYPIIENYKASRKYPDGWNFQEGNEVLKKITADKIFELDKIVKESFSIERYKTTCCDCG